MDQLITLLNNFFQYYFSVYSTYGTIQEGNFVPFEKFHVDSGNAIDLSTGIFTAPVSGVYEFAFSGNTFSGSNCLIGVHKNDWKAFHSFYDSGGTDWEFANLGSTWIVSLDAGDTMRLKVKKGKLYSDNDMNRILTGKLLEITS